MYLGFPSIQMVGQSNAERSTFDNISQDFEAQPPGLQCLSLLWDLAWEVRTMAYKSATPLISSAWLDDPLIGHTIKTANTVRMVSQKSDINI